MFNLPNYYSNKNNQSNQNNQNNQNKMIKTDKITTSMNILIEDCRFEKDFNKISFSGYKKNEVKKQLIKEILNERIEHSNYWLAELICAGHYLDIWEIILLVLSKYIHYGNPKLAIYIEMRYNVFKGIVITKYGNNEIDMRNNIEIRKLFSEIISILCFSQKKVPLSDIKIDIKDFNMTEINHRLKADGLHYVNDIFMENDPKELFIASNELAYSIKQNNKNTQNAYYWYSWIVEFETKCKSKNKECYICDKREYIPVQDKYKNDIIWIVWDIILNETKSRDKMTLKLINSIFNLYCIRYSPGVKKKRKHLIYYVLLLLTDNIDYKIQITKKKDDISIIQSKLDYIYKDIKKNEINNIVDNLHHNEDNNLQNTKDNNIVIKNTKNKNEKNNSEEMNYLYHGLNKSSNTLENTITKLDKMKGVDFFV
jgi:hypothetical protein